MSLLVYADLPNTLHSDGRERRSLCRMFVVGRRKGSQHSSGCGLVLEMLVSSYWSSQVFLASFEMRRTRRALTDETVQRPVRSCFWQIWGWGEWKTCSKTRF